MGKRRKQDLLPRGCWNCEKKTFVCSRLEVLECLNNSKCSICGFSGYNSKYGRINGRTCSHCGSEWPIYK